MVDPTKGIGSIQNLISGTRVTEPAPVKRNDVAPTASEPEDKVTLSPKALSLTEAKQISESVRSYLEEDTQVSLVGKILDESL